MLVVYENVEKTTNKTLFVLFLQDVMAVTREGQRNIC